MGGDECDNYQLAAATKTKTATATGNNKSPTINQWLLTKASKQLAETKAANKHCTAILAKSIGAYKSSYQPVHDDTFNQPTTSNKGSSYNG